jgi:hypothetical protein
MWLPAATYPAIANVGISNAITASGARQAGYHLLVCSQKWIPIEACTQTVSTAVMCRNG